MYVPFAEPRHTFIQWGPDPGSIFWSGTYGKPKRNGRAPYCDTVWITVGLHACRLRYVGLKASEFGRVRDYGSRRLICDDASRVE